MSKTKFEPTNLGSIARGALMELFAKNMVKIAENIADSTTDAETPREITLKLKFKPDADRVGCKLTTTATCKLASVSQHVSRVYVTKATNGQAFLFDEDPRQAKLFEAPEPGENIVDFKSRGAGSE